MNTINDTGLVRLIEDTAANKIVADRSQWVARGDGVKPDGSDNAQVTSEASNIYLPIDGLRTDIKEFYDPYEIDDGDFIFAPYSSGTSCELRISNVKWSKDGVELYKVCGGELSDYGKSEDGLPWYQVEGYEECSTTQNIMAYLLEDDTVKITTNSEGSYKDKVLIATVKDGVINRIVKSVIMKSASAEQVEIVRDWTVRNNGVRWEIFNPVWNLSDKQAVYPSSMDALCWNAVTDTSGKLYANLVSENKIADDGTVTTDRSVILSSTENDIGQACVSLTSVSSVLIGEFKKDCDGNITGFCQYSDGAIAQAEPKLSTINVFTRFKTATVETTGASSSSSSTETHLHGFTTPIKVVAGKECTEPPALDIKLSDITGGSSDSWVPSVDISDIVDTSTSSSGTVAGQKIAISFTCNTTGEVISDEGSVYNGRDGAVYSPEVTSSKGEQSTDVTIAFVKDDGQTISHTFTVKDGRDGKDGGDGQPGKDGTTYTPSITESISGDTYEGTTHNITFTFTPNDGSGATIEKTISIKDGTSGEGTKGDKGDTGPYYIPYVKIGNGSSSSESGNKITFCFTKSDDSSDVKVFGPMDLGNGLVYGPPTIVAKPSSDTDQNGGKALALRYPIGTIGPDGSFTECSNLAGKAAYVDLISHIVLKDAEACSKTNEMVISYDRGYFLCAVEETQASSGGSSSSGGTESKRFCMCRGMSLASFKPSEGKNSIIGYHGWFDEKSGLLHDEQVTSDRGVKVLCLLASENILVCTASSIDSLTGTQYTVDVGNKVESNTVIVRQESQIVTGGSYNQPTEDGDVGSVSIKIASSKFAVFAGSTSQETDKVLLYTATASSQSGDTYSGTGNS